MCSAPQVGYAMLTEQHRQTLQSLRQCLWASGITNPITSLEQISYLLVLRWLETLDAYLGPGTEGRSPARTPLAAHPTCRWSALRQIDSERRFSTVREQGLPLLQRLNMFGHGYVAAMKDAVFSIPNPNVLAEVFELIDSLPLEFGADS